MERNKVIYNSKQLAQVRPANTSTAVLLNPIDKNRNIVYTIMIANTTGSSATVSLFHDKDGTTFDQSTSLLYQVPVPANETIILDYNPNGIALSDQDNLGIQVGTSNALTITVYGIDFGASGN